MADDVTTVHLKDGTTLHLKGKGLSAEMVSEKVSAFRASQAPAPPDPTKPEPTAALSKAQVLKPLTEAAEESKQGFLDLPFSSQGGMRPAFGAVPGEVHRRAEETKGMLGLVAGGTAFGPEATAGLPFLTRALASSSGAGFAKGLTELIGGKKPKAALESAAKGTAETMAAEVGIGGVARVGGKALAKVDPLIKINKLLGVGPSEVVPGKTPASLDEFAANPARGAMKAGLTEEKLAAMKPLERNAAIMKAKDAAGQQLESLLNQAGAAGKKVDLYPTLDKVFDSIPDPKVAKQAENAFIQILKENNITLNELTPMQARTIQRSLEDVYTGDLKDIGVQLRRGISAATRKAVPEIAPLDQNYWDLSNAAKGTQKLAKRYATEIPENKLRKMFIESAVKGLGWGTLATAGGGVMYELYRALGGSGGRGGSPTPVP